MKRFERLSAEWQAKAVEKCTADLLKIIVESGIRFNDKLNHDKLQARIDAACAKAEEMQTPWFAGEYIMETCREEIEGMARCDAEDSLYPDPGEHVITGI